MPSQLSCSSHPPWPIPPATASQTLEASYPALTVLDEAPDALKQHSLTPALEVVLVFHERSEDEDREVGSEEGGQLGWEVQLPQ